jgi:hypothetical protein
MLERKCVVEKTGTLVQPQMAPSSWQCAAHTSLKTTDFVTNNNMVIILHPPYTPYTVSQIENETEVTMFWNSVWHPKRTASGTRQH